MKSAQLLLVAAGVACHLLVWSASADQQDEDKLVAKYEKVLDEFDSEQPAAFKALFKAQRIDRLKRDYKRLNAELLKRVPDSEEPAQNLQAAGQLLQSAVDTKDGLAEALEYFVALGELDAGERCNGRSETILRLNDYLTEGRARSDEPRDIAKRNRVDKIVNHFAVQHERQCRDVYAAKYNQKLAELEADERDRLFGVLSDDKLAHALADSAQLLTELMFISSNLRLADKFKPTNELLANLVFNWLLGETANTDASFLANGVVDSGQFELTYERYLAGPCRSYVIALGREVFRPAILDLGTSGEVLKRKLQSDDDVKYVLGLGRYAICDSVLRQGDSFRRLVAREINKRYS